ncbi:ABC-2 type transport system ATP-binding protein [Cyclonatronum proteinivorum]|uniref:ABC-2 type transport system ATP-binding protein n=1 Tax=Cyclonatronum proteinivorum TaxID=1457365 RepID=A0A345UJ02_9BACT|nr:ABC transporter ATP-binding protein [Cyclonatronum proteinivorum]AXJ00454.1 ABC-2 type transport system ATP-binding protein [Cyclonatronum proteinivorum]
MSVIQVNQIVKRYGAFTAVDDVSFNVEKGRIFGVLGPNGAGKTTTIRMINFITIPDSGQVLIKGAPASAESQKLIGYLPEERGLYKKMKVGDQLLYLARLKGMNDHDARKSLTYWLDRFKATDWIKKELGELSKGQQQKVQFISTIAHDPEICIFDEPFSGLDPINAELLREVILELNQKGKTILFATHRMEQVEQMCDDICLFNNGKLLLTGSLADVKRSFGNNTVKLSFLGDGSFIDGLENVRINNRSANYAEIRLLDGTSEQDVLQTAVQHVQLTHFEFVQPSLNEIFISTVNNATAAESATQTAKA